MDIKQIKRYLPSGWDVVDLIDHGIVDLDIMSGRMMGEYVAMLMVKSDVNGVGYSVATFSFHDKDMDNLRTMVRDAIMATGLRNGSLSGDGNTAIR